MVVKFQLENGQEFIRASTQALKKVNDLRIPIGETARDIFKNTQPKFNFPGSGPFAPLSPKYKAFKERAKPGAKILNFSGRLRKSVTPPGSSDSILVIGKKEGVVGSSVPYARAINDGAPRNNLPARPFFFIDPAQEIRINRIFGDFIAAKLEVLGRVSNG